MSYLMGQHLLVFACYCVGMFACYCVGMFACYCVGMSACYCTIRTLWWMVLGWENFVIFLDQICVVC